MAALFIAGCDGPEIFQPVYRAFDDVAAFVSHRIEAWWRSASTSFSQAVFLRITPLWANTTHAPVLDLLPIMACTISTIDAQAGWTFSWASPPRTGHADGVEHRSNLRRIAAVPSSDYDRQWQAVPVDAQVNLASDAAARPPQPLVGYGPLFSAAGLFFRAPEALRWALTWVASSAAPSQSIRPASSAVACMTLSRRCQVPLRDQRTNRS